MKSSSPATASAGANTHHQLLTDARSHRARQYMRRGVAPPRQTFGIEIEFCGGDTEAIGKELYELGLTHEPEQGSYHGRRQEGKWAFESDSSVDGEIVSPVLTDSATTWKQLAQVCQVVRKHGGYADEYTGSHVHVGLASSGLVGVKKLKRLVRLYAWSEDLLFRLAASPELAPFHRGILTDFGYVGALSEDSVREALEARDAGGVAGALCQGEGMTLENIHKGTVEFRVNDGSLDAERLQANILIDCALVRAAARLRDEQIPSTTHLLGSNLRRKRSDRSLLRDFVELTLDTPQRKRKAYSLYLRTAWQPDEATAHAHIRRVRCAAVDAEVRRIQRHVGTTPVSPEVETRLRRFVDPDGEWRDSAEEALPPAVEAGVRWWMGRALPSQAPETDRWNRVRRERAGELLWRAEISKLETALLEQEGRAPLPAESSWLSLMIRGDGGAASSYQASTAAIARVFQDWMNDRSADRIRKATPDGDAIGKRWQACQEQTARCAKERELVVASVQNSLERSLSPAEEDAIFQLTRYDGDHKRPLAAILQLDTLHAVRAGLEKRVPGRDYAGERAAVIRDVTAFIDLAESFRVFRAAHDLTNDDVTWLYRAFESCMGLRQPGNVPPAPSAQALTALREFSGQQQQAQDHPLWTHDARATVYRAERAWEQLRYQEVLKAEVDGISEEYRARHDRDPSPLEVGWFADMAGCDGGDPFDPPTTEAQELCRDWLKRPVPDQAPNLEDWKFDRERNAIALGTEDEVKRLLAEVGNLSGTRLNPAEQTWLAEVADPRCEEPQAPPSRRVALIAQKAFDATERTTSRWEIDEDFWAERGYWWEDGHDWVTSTYIAELIDEYNALGQHRPRTAARRRNDINWLTSMLDFDMHADEVFERWLSANERPSSAARTLFEQWHAADLTNFDGTPATELREDLAVNWKYSQAADVVTDGLAVLRRRLRQARADSPESIDAWLGRFQAGSGFDGPELSKTSRGIVFEWVKDRPQGDPEVVDIAMQHRRDCWMAFKRECDRTGAGIGL